LLKHRPSTVKNDSTIIPSRYFLSKGTKQRQLKNVKKFANPLSRPNPTTQG
jgi:hypothetical protein